MTPLVLYRDAEVTVTAGRHGCDVTKAGRLIGHISETVPFGALQAIVEYREGRRTAALVDLARLAADTIDPPAGIAGDTEG